jgi:ABC-type Mn2+/Zn2+ transport system ATPase subunit
MLDIKSGISLRIEGFRSHKQLKVFFPEKSSVYVCGPNGSGKSDIYRAIKWVLFPKKNDKVHPIGTSTTVKVTLKVISTNNNIKVMRTVLPGTVEVKYNKKKYKGPDAENMITTLFGNKKVWNLTSYVEAGLHPFVIANNQQRAVILNEFIGDEKAKENISTILSETKSKLKTLNAEYEKEMIRYEATYGEELLDQSKILSDSEVSNIKSSIISNKDLITKYQKDLQAKSLLAEKIKHLETNLAKIPNCTSEGLESLKFLCEKTKKFMLVNDAYTKAKTALSPHQVPNKKYSQDDLNEALISNKIYESNNTICNQIGVEYNENAISTAIHKCEISLKYGEIMAKIANYEKVESNVRTLCGNKSLEEIKTQETNTQEKLTKVQKNLSYVSLFKRHSDVAAMNTELFQMLKKLNIDTVDKLEGIINTTEQIISKQWIFKDRKEYENVYSTIYGNENLPKNTEDFAVTELMQAKEKIENIERSKSMMQCPHCNGPVIYLDGNIKKFDGEVVCGNVSQLKKQVEGLTKLAKLKYPDIPSGINEIDVDAAKNKVTMARKCITLQKSIQTITQNLETIPDGVEKVDEIEANRSIVYLKKELTTLLKCKEALITLNSLEKPALPEKNSEGKIEIMNEAKAKLMVDKLKKVQTVSKPEHSPQLIKLFIEYQEAYNRYMMVSKPEKYVKEQDIRDYSTNLTILNNTLADLKKAKDDISKIPVTQDMLLSLKSDTKDLEKKLADNIKFTAMDKFASEINALCDKLDDMNEEYNNICEFKEIFERDFNICMKETVRGIGANVNEFLTNCGTDVRIKIPTGEDKTKIICFKNGIEYGSIWELSSGERSLVSFAFRIAFSLNSENDILILDEITDNLSVDIKDICIELMLDIMKKAGKTILLSDHHCHSGDYDKIIDLTQK